MEAQMRGGAVVVVVREVETEELSISKYTAHVETFYQSSICFLHIEQTLVCVCILAAQCLYVWAAVLAHLACVL